MGSETKGHLRPQKRHCKLRHITLRATIFKHEIGTLLVIFQENSVFFFWGGGIYLREVILSGKYGVAHVIIQLLCNCSSFQDTQL